MDIQERLKMDVFLHFNLVQVVVTVAGCFIIFFFMLEACPGLMGMAGELASRGAWVGVLLGAVSLAYNSQLLRALYRLQRFTFTGREMPAGSWERLQEATFRLPLRLLVLTFLMWPPGIALIALWLKLTGVLNLTDSVRIAVCGLLYSPLQGLILFYSTRYSMRNLAAQLHELGHGATGEHRGGVGIRGKLIGSFVCLAVIPLLAGVLISQVQRERVTVDLHLDDVCQALDRVQAAAGARNTPEAWGEAVKATEAQGGLPQRTAFLVTDKHGALLTGEFDRPARKVWRQGITEPGDAGECTRMPVAGQRRFIVMKYYAQPGVWISAVTFPFPPPAPFWSSHGVTMVLVAVVILIGVFLGYMAAADVTGPVRRLSETAVAAARGERALVSGFLPDDELSELSFAFNSLVSSIHQELKRSSSLVSQVREVITGLGEQTANIAELGERQRQVIDEQNSLSVQASAGAEQVTRASADIKERAHSTSYQMDEAAVATHEADATLVEMGKIIQDMMAHSERIWTKMDNLESNYRRMEEVVKIIDDIAERTEILSLNAALEAGTRAEVGDRLSVVASEVQRLSERISEQTADIRTLFNEIRMASMEMAQAIDVARNRAKEGPQWLRRLTDSLSGIENRARAAAGSMNDIVSMTGEQTQSLEQMKILISEIQAVASVIDEVNTGSESTVDRLNNLAAHLGQLVKEKGEGK